MSANDDTLLINSDQVPEYDKPTLPDTGEVIIFVEEDNFDYGGKIDLAYRLPLRRIVPTNSLQSTSYSIEAPDAGIAVPGETVVPGYVEAFDPYLLKRAQSNNASSLAQFLIISTDQNIDDNYVIQGSGFYRFPTTHNYLVGQQYYLSDSAAGGVTTTPPAGTKQKLFIPVDQSTILINISIGA